MNEGTDAARAELIERARAGESEAFSVLWRESVPTLRRNVLRIVKDPADADDVLQEVAISALRNFNRFRGEGTVLGWLTVVARNQSLECLRRRRTQMVPLDCPLTQVEIVSWAPSPERVCVRNDLMARAARRLRGMPAKYRVALQMYAFDECPQQEIARHLGVRVNTVRVWIHRARIELCRTCALDGGR